nr:4370_t:CDS:10 [Entrophospora candida]
MASIPKKIKSSKTPSSLFEPTTRSYHTLQIEDITKHLNTNIEEGLTNKEVTETRLPIYGLNELSRQGNVSVFSVFFIQVKNALMLILLVAMIFSFITKDYVDAGIIGFVVIINVLIGFFQEYRAEKTIESLRKMSSPTARVIRENALVSIPANTLVPGDIIVIEEGDVISADAQLFECFNLEVNEALLTGDSAPVAKSVDVVEEHDETSVERSDLIYSNTTVTKGRGKGIVTSTGMKTAIGKVAKNLSSSSVIQRTPLQKKVDMMAYILFGVAILLSIIVFGVNGWKFSREIVIYVVSVIIAILPEGLAVVIILTITLGLRQMAKNKVIFRKLSAFEALGSVTNICTDKTGTLTQTKMIATNVWLLQEGFYKITGRDDYTPEGKIYKIGPTLSNKDNDENDNNDDMRENMGNEKGKGNALLADEEVKSEDMSYAFIKLVQTAALCNMAIIRKGDGVHGEWNAMGNPIESALQVFAHKVELSKPLLESDKYKFKLIMEFHFDTQLKRMSVIYKNEFTNEYCVFLKGATESVLKQCTKFQVGDVIVKKGITNDEKFKLEINNGHESLAGRGLHVISLAYRKINSQYKTDKEISKMTREETDNDMIFLGIVGIYNPPRPESKTAVMKCFGSGIEVHMLTGDHPLTAATIAKKIGILPSTYLTDNNNFRSQSQLVMTATQFDALTDEQIDELKELPRVIARCSTETKVKMIEALHRRNKFVAMTGNNINDSPSLKKADIGIAMGMGGNDMTKQASDVVLTDGNFATVVNAISEGRRIFGNMQNFISYLLSVNVSEIIVLMIGLAFIDTDRLPINPLSLLQILFLNMVTSTPLAIALGAERESKDIMKHLPCRYRRIFSWEVIADTIFYGCVAGGLTLTNFILVIYVTGDRNLGSGCNYNLNPSTATEEGGGGSCEQVFRGRGVAFATLTFLLFIRAYNCRSLKDLFRPTRLYSDNKFLFWTVVGGALVSILALYIPGLNTQVFHQLGFSWEWGLVSGAIVIFEVFVEVYKFIKRHYCSSLIFVGEDGGGECDDDTATIVTVV